MMLLASSTMTLPDNSNALFLTSQTTLEILMISEEDSSKVRPNFGMRQTMNTSSILIMTLKDTTQSLTSSTPSPVTPHDTAKKKLALTSLTLSPSPRSTTQLMVSSTLTMRSPPPSKIMSSNVDAETDS